MHERGGNTERAIEHGKKEVKEVNRQQIEVAVLSSKVAGENEWRREREKKIFSRVKIGLSGRKRRGKRTEVNPKLA